MRLLAGVFGVLAVFLSGCSDPQTPPVEKKLVRAGDQYIAEGDVQYQLSRFDESTKAAIEKDKGQYRNLLDSMALTRLLAQKQYASMTDDQRDFFDHRVRAYRDEMLAKEYISTQLHHDVPDRKAVEDYYRSHLESFGAVERYKVSIQYLADDCPLKPEWLSGPVSADQYESITKLSCSIKASRKELASDELHRDFPTLPESPPVNSGIWVSTSYGQALIYVEEKNTSSARPLYEVVGEIRKRMAPEYMKRALQAERQKFGKEIEYFDQ